MTSAGRFALGSTAALAVLVIAATEAPAEESSAADAAFRRGRALLAEGRVAEACEAFATSHQLEPALDTLLNLADCHERAGRTATAWREFTRVREQALASKRQPFADEAGRRLGDLEPRLTRMMIAVAEPRPAAMVVERDGADQTESLGTAVALDPGTYSIEARAPGYRTWSREIEIGGAGATVAVAVPALEALSRAPTTPTAVDPGVATRRDRATVPSPVVAGADGADDRGRGRRTLAVSIGGGGVAALATGLVFGGLAVKKWDASRDRCDEATVCDGKGVELTESAVTRATISTVLVSIGLAAVGAGVYLYLTAPDHRSVGAAAAVTPYFQSNGGGVAVVGRF